MSQWTAVRLAFVSRTAFFKEKASRASRMLCCVLVGAVLGQHSWPAESCALSPPLLHRGGTWLRAAENHRILTGRFWAQPAGQGCDRAAGRSQLRLQTLSRLSLASLLGRWLPKEMCLKRDRPVRDGHGRPCRRPVFMSAAQPLTEGKHSRWSGSVVEALGPQPRV